MLMVNKVEVKYIYRYIPYPFSFLTNGEVL